MFKVDKYVNSPCQFPSHDIPQKEKMLPKYALQFCKAFHYSYCSDRIGGVTNSTRAKLIRNKSYCLGEQDRTQYNKIWYGPNNNAEVMREGLGSINYKILRAVSRYVNGFVGKFNDMDFDVNLESYSQFIREEKEQKMWDDFVRGQLKKHKIDVGGAEPEGVVPETLEELRVLEKMGVFSHKLEYAWESLIERVFKENDVWDTRIKSMMLRDFFANHRAATWDYVDKPTQRMMTKYLPPENTIVRRTQDGRVIDGGYYELMTIADLRIESGFSEKELMEVAMCYVNCWGNPYEWKWRDDIYLKWGDLGNCPYDDYRVLVLKCEYMSVDKDYYYQNTKKPDKPIGHAEYGKVYSDKSQRKTIVSERRNYYKGAWLVYTDKTYDCGLQYDIPRPNMAEARCSLHYYEAEGPSPIEVMEPILDLVQIAFEKYQNAWGNAAVDGQVFDEAVLRNTTLGQKLKPTDTIRLGRATGIYVISSMNDKNRPNMAPNASNPITPIQGGVGKIQEEFMEAYAMFNNILVDLSGMSEAAMGQPVDGKAVGEMQLMATNTALKPTVDGMMWIKKSMAQNLLLRGQVLFRCSPPSVDYYTKILGKDLMKVIEISLSDPDKDYTQFGLTVNVTNNAEIRQLILQGARESQQAGRNGLPGITWVEFSQITRMVKSGANLQYIEALIGRLEDKRQKEMERAKNEATIIQSQAQSEGAIAVNESQKDLVTHQANEQIRVELVKAWAKNHYDTEKAVVTGQIQQDNAIAGILVENLVAPLLNGGQQTQAPAAPM